jgi:hypothetical protein
MAEFRKKRPPGLGTSFITAIENESKVAAPTIVNRTLDSDIAHYKLDDVTRDGIQLTASKAITTVNDDVKQICDEQSAMNRKVSYITNDAIGSEPVPNNHFVSQVFGSTYGDDSKWIKIYRCDSRFSTVLHSEFIFEVYYQTKAFQLNGSCKFISPEVHEYGCFEDSDSYYCYIIMDLVSEPKLTGEQCKRITPGIESVNECLKSNNLYHNDLLPRNVFEDKQTRKPIIIDYGLSLSKERGNQSTWVCNIDERWDLPNVVTPEPEHQFNGGRRATKRKRNKKPRKTKRKRNKKNKK